MFQTGPEIHGNGTDLNLHLGLHRSICEIDRHSYYHMITFVSVGLGVFDIVLYMKDGHIPLIRYHAGYLVDIRRERTYNPDTRNIAEALHHILNGYLVSVLLKLHDNAFS